MTDSEKMDLILSEMQGMKSEMQGMKSEMQDMKSEVQDMKSEMQDMKSEVQGMKSEMQDMKSEVQGMKSEMQDIWQKVDEVEQKVTKTNLIIENELRVNIQRVAEGHLDLSRILHDAMQPSGEVEVLGIKVRMLESEVKKLKERKCMAG